MDVRLSPEQRALRDVAAQVAERFGPRSVGELDDADRARRLNDAIEAAGWRQLRAPAENDTPLASGVEAAIVAEELARCATDSPYLGPLLASDLRRLVGAAPSEAPETVALGPRLTGLAGADDILLDAGVVAIDALSAQTALLASRSGGRLLLGSTAVKSIDARVDLTRPVAVPTADAVVNVVPGQRDALTADHLATWTALGLALGSADLVGTMRGAIQLATDYARERKQYGTAIGSFQAVQHLLADAFVAMEGSRSIALHAAWAVDALPPADALYAAAAAKAYCSRAARSVCETAIQVHGGIGNTWECLAHVYLRRALLTIDMFGGEGTNLDRVLRHLDIGAAAAGTEAIDVGLIGANDGLR